MCQEPAAGTLRKINSLPGLQVKNDVILFPAALGDFFFILEEHTASLNLSFSNLWW